MSKKPNIVYVGSKPPMNYVMAVMQGISMTDAGEVVLKARGRAISTAVDVAEITRRRFMTDLQVSRVTIGTEELEVEGGRMKGVSSMEIVLTTSSKKAGSTAEGAGVREELPEGLRELMEIEGIGSKTALKLYQELKISSIEELESAAKQGKVVNLEGFGEKTEENILQGIEKYRRSRVKNV